jgi:hypothetical protein
MDYKQIRIRTDLGIDNKYINFKLDQEFDDINILSLKLTQSDVYNSFNSDYGCVVGRVIANDGVGIPNAKISIFIPLDEQDENNEDIKSIYPYKTPEDLDLNGYKYNLLPRVSQVSPFIGSGFNVNNVGYTPKTPVGTFPTKEEILTNDTLLEVYKKYYKFSTVTNESGDYMIFGVPVGTHFIHMSVDITDIGKYSMVPTTMVKLLGYSENLFENNGTTIRKTNDLDDLPNIQLENISIDVRPFWGDQDNFEIGITRQDFKIKARLTPTFTVFGSMVTMGSDGLWGISKSPSCSGLGANTCLFYTINNYDDGNGDISGFNVANFRLPKPLAEVYTINPNITDDEIDNNNFNINTDIIKLQKNDYSEFVDNGMFVYIIPCNRTKIIINEFGEEVPVELSNLNGIFTEFNGYFLMDTEDLSIEGNPTRDGVEGDRGPFIRLKSRFKIPQGGNDAYLVNDNENNSLNQNFIKKNKKFKAGEFYSVSQFYSISYATGSGSDIINSDLNQPKYRTLGIIQTEESFTDVVDPSITGDTPTEIITETDFPSNTNPNNIDKYFGSQWINMCLFQIQFAATDRRRDNRIRVAGFLLEDSRDSKMFFIRDNTQNLGGGRFNSKGFISARYHYFDFIDVKREDIIIMSELSKKIIRRDIDGLIGNDYKYTNNGTVLANIATGSLGGNLVGRDLNGSSPYIYKGLYEADCINYLISLNLI